LNEGFSPTIHQIGLGHFEDATPSQFVA